VIDSVLVEHLEEALRLLDPAPSGLRCLLSARLAAATQPAPNPEQPVAMARRAIAEARAMHDDALLRDVLLVGTSAMADFCPPEEVRDLSKELLTNASGDQAAALRAYFRLVLAELQLGDFAAMDAHLDELLRLAAGVGHPRLIWQALLLGSMRAIARGRFDESERLISDVQRLSMMTDDPALSLALVRHQQLRSLDLHQTELAEVSLAVMDQSTANLPAGPVLRPLLRALTWIRLGDRAKAARAFAGFPTERVRSAGPSAPLGFVGEVCAAVGSTDQRRLLRDLLMPAIDRELTFGYSVLIYGGPVRRVVGLLEAALANRDDAERYLGEALEACRRRGFWTWVSRIAFELGEIRGDRGLLEEAAGLAESIGVDGLARRARALLGAAPTAASRPAAPKELVLEREGEVWRVAQAERQIRVPHSRGMELLARLLDHPGEEIHVLVLASDTGEALVERDDADALDAQAAQSYRKRLDEIEAELDRTHAHGDLGRSERLVRERDLLRAELSRAFGLGGAPRRGGASERARVNVQRRLKDAIARIAQYDPELGDYLRRAIRTGTYCTFRP
jgi:tetratricopeptide (TPR) repeat protein